MPKWGGWDLGRGSREGNVIWPELMAKADHWDLSFGAHPALCPFSLGMHYSALLAMSVTSGEAAYISLYDWEFCFMLQSTAGTNWLQRTWSLHRNSWMERSWRWPR